MAEISSEYYRELIEEGLDKEVAAKLTVGYIRTLLNILIVLRLKQTFSQRGDKPLIKPLATALTELNQDNTQYLFMGLELMEVGQIDITISSEEQQVTADIKRICSIDQIEAFTVTGESVILYGDFGVNTIWLDKSGVEYH